MERQFTSGSRQAPDPFDQFLEEHNYYRKHTARDSSCLFRVISEQMYDTQMHHLAIREKCVTYMRKYRKHFDYHVDRDFDEYLDDMSKPKTYGTLLELQAASYMFQRNVFLFQPFNLGNYFNEYRTNFVEVFRVFYTPERHFDSVFTSEYIQEAAICQSICYEILYKDLFKLPDVSFAVEQMLHGPTFENMDYRTETNEDGYTSRFHLSDGRSFELDLPHNTNCILEDYKLCHFHYNNFPRYSDDLQRELKANNFDEYEKNTFILQRTAESFLPNKYMSCVRQLLQEGITPFPYKVAKALDPNMYRNIEFDSWNEIRKELKLQNWYNGDANFKLIRYSTRRVRKIFQVGAKCHVKLRKSEKDLYTCHIQEIAVDKGQCIVFVEQLGEKRLVPYENLSPLPPDQFKPWTVPYRLQRHMQKYSSVRFTHQYNYRFKFNTSTGQQHHHEFACESSIENDTCSNNYIDDNPKQFACQQQNQHYAAAASYFKLKQYTHLEDFRTHVEYCTMPLTVAHTNREIEVLKSSGGAGGNQSRMIDSSENSRTSPRSSTSAGISRHNAEAASAQQKGPKNTHVEENLEQAQTFVAPSIEGYDLDYNNSNTTFYMPEMQGFYPMYPYSPATAIAPEDYYAYCGYDGAMPPGTTFVPSANNVNGIYYVCNNALAATAGYINSANSYFIPPPPLHPLGVAQHSSVVPSVNTPNSLYYTTPSLHNESNSTQSNQALPPPLQCSVNSTIPGISRRSGSNSPTNAPHTTGHVNFDAKKSLNNDGVDLPNDLPTLRYFYNIGLDYYNNQKCIKTEDETFEDNIGLKNLQIDENPNQVLSIKSEVDNKSSDTPHISSSNQILIPMNNNNNNPPMNSVSTGAGNKNNNNNNTSQRRYISRYFNGKDRQISQHNNNSNQSSQSCGQHHQLYQQQNFPNNQQRSFNNPKYANNNYNATNVYNNTRQNTKQPKNQHQIQLQSTTENCRQIETSRRINSTELRSCNTSSPTNNSNNGVAYTNNSDQMNDRMVLGAGNGGQLTLPMQSAAGGVYIPIPVVPGPPPPPAPFGIYTAHLTGNVGHQPPGVGMSPNYMTGPPPQIISHCGPQQPGTLNFVAGSDNTENVCNSEITTNSGPVMAMPPSGIQIQCPNYPPPMPIYYSANAVNPIGACPPGGVNGPTSGVHFSHQMTSSTHTNQTPFASPHPTMGTQGYYCLQPPPLLQHQQQVTPQFVQQSPPMTANKTTVPNALPHDANKGPRNELVQPQND